MSIAASLSFYLVALALSPKCRHIDAELCCCFFQSSALFEHVHDVLAFNFLQSRGGNRWKAGPFLAKYRVRQVVRGDHVAAAEDGSTFYRIAQFAQVAWPVIL